MRTVGFFAGLLEIESLRTVTLGQYICADWYVLPFTARNDDEALVFWIHRVNSFCSINAIPTYLEVGGQIVLIPIDHG